MAVIFLKKQIGVLAMQCVVCIPALACLIKPKSHMGISYPPNLVHILILLGFAKKIKLLARRGI